MDLINFGGGLYDEIDGGALPFIVENEEIIRWENWVRKWEEKIRWRQINVKKKIVEIIKVKISWINKLNNIMVKKLG